MDTSSTKRGRAHFSLNRIWQSDPQPFFRSLANWQFILVFVALILFTNWLGHRWLFERATLAGTDVLLSVSDPKLAQYCHLITIDEREFDTYLGEWLQPEKLTKVLASILAFKPKVLVVDIETSGPRFRDLEIPQSSTKIVWARVSHQILEDNRASSQRSYVWNTGSVLGNRNPLPEYVGSPLFPQDPDWTVRGFQRMTKIDANVHSLHWESLRAYCDSGAERACSLFKPGAENTAESDEEALKKREFQANWSFQSYPLSDVVRSGENLKPGAGELGEIVLLGARFSDIHQTSFGPKLGIEMIGSAIESELAGESEECNFCGWGKWIVKVSLALAIVWLNSRLVPICAAAGTLVLLSFVFVASFLGIYYSLFRMEFLPFMVGIWIEQLIEGTQHAQRAH